MAVPTSIRRLARSQPAWFWAFAAASLLVIVLIGFRTADRLTAPSATPSSVEIVADVEPRPTESTVNEFLPEERGLGECISAVPKPGCGSEARGGWRQGLVLLAILAGLGVIAWRVVAASRAARRPATPVGDADQRR